VHIDKRASTILAADTGDADQLLTTRETARLLGVSEEWLEIGRSRGYGPTFTRLSARCVRYSRGNIREFLRQRSHKSTAAFRGRTS
jgi:hypothetical protein